MFIYTYTEAEGTESRRVANDIDQIMKPAFGDRPSANGHSSGTRLNARMFKEYEAARGMMLNDLVTEDMLQLVNMGIQGVGLNVVSPHGLTLCHIVQGNAVCARIDIDDLHYRQQWSASPMEAVDRERIAEASQVFLDHAKVWREQLAAAFKADSKGVKMRNMALNNMDAYLKRYFEGTGITYCCDKNRADGHKSRLLVRLNAYKTLELPIPHDDFINHLDLVKPYMVEFALMARDGRFTVRGEVRDDWQTAPVATDETGNSAPDEQPKGLKKWLKRIATGSKDKAAPEAPKSPLQQAVDTALEGKKWQYHLTEGFDIDEEEIGKEDSSVKIRQQLHIRLPRGKAMIIDLGLATAAQRIAHDTAYIPRLVELSRMFPYSVTGPRKVEWTTAPRDQQ